MAFDDETIDVLIGGYMSKDAAQEDYEAVLASGGYLHGAVVVSKDLKGNLSVEQTVPSGSERCRGPSRWDALEAVGDTFCRGVGH